FLPRSEAEDLRERESVRASREVLESRGGVWPHVNGVLRYCCRCGRIITHYQAVRCGPLAPPTEGARPERPSQIAAGLDQEASAALCRFGRKLEQFFQNRQVILCIVDRFLSAG